MACAGSPTPLAPYLRGSVGLPHQGVQTDSMELPRRGPGFARYRPYGSANFGQPELVAAITEVAARVRAESPGSPDLVLGDLSAEFGGRIPRHNSHRSGRDVDLLWFVTTPAGRPLPSPGFVRIGEDGLAQSPQTGEIFRLDVRRQWLTVKAFLQSDEVAVQWMFCSRAIEALLIEYARARGEPDALVWRAETVLLQPADSLPHDDHIHLRISCTPETSLVGCEGGGPYWEWLPPPPNLEELTDEDWRTLVEADPLPRAGQNDERSLSEANELDLGRVN